MLDFMKRSLSPGFTQHPGFVPYIVVVGALALASMLILVWHAAYSLRHCATKWELCMGYLAPRLTCYGLFALYIGVLGSEVC